jgi:hypothetical protein
MISSTIGFIILGLKVLLIKAASILHILSFQNTFLFALVIIPLVIGLIYVGKLEWLSMLKGDKNKYNFEKGDIFNFIAVVIGALLTFTLSNYFAMGPVIAASLVGIIATVIVPKYDVPVYCGSFVGMASIDIFGTYSLLLLAGIIAAFIYVISKNVFTGFGGKLGAIAFAGCLSASLLGGRTLGSSSVPEWNTAVLLVIYSILGAVLTYIISVRLKNSSVISSGITGILGGLILPVAYPETGNLLAVMVICASFAGMSSKKRIANEILIAIVGFLCAILFIFTAPYFGGAGGKLGTIAFSSGIAIYGVKEIIFKVQENRWINLARNTEKI